ncbi:MAG: hypothetical protein A3I66_08495 [Burkholderiales bacterium RIFCSPLOWO2_02_FULL_57_36]|nr:MAG: hypothetical protein A3I66_08495 [Burkholderiales bacterium RIFCSPLOWO2_02_FULL_57_36]
MTSHPSRTRRFQPFNTALLACLLLLAHLPVWAAKDVASVTVDTQVGTATYGTAGAVTYTVSFTSSGNGNGSCDLAVTGLPTGVTPNFSGGTTINFSNGNPSPTTTLTLTTDAGTAQAIIGAVFTVTCSDPGASASDSGTITINRKALTVTANNLSKIYGNTLTFAGTEFTSSGLVNGDTVASVTLTSSGASITATVAGSPYAIVPSAAVGSGLANYNIAYINGSLTVNTRPITVTADAQSKNVGDPDPPLTYQVTSGSLVNGDTFSGALNRLAGETPGTYTILQNTLALSANYALTYVAANLTINNFTPGSFNAFESSTAAAATTGKIYTKLAGTAFSLDVVAIFSGAQMNGFTNAAIVELVGNQNTGVALNPQNCPVSFTLIQTVSPNPTITSGRSTVNFAAVANAWKDVRVRIRYPVGSPTVISCSTDNFSIRPTAFSVISTNATNTGTSGMPSIKTGANFNLTATAIAGYNGTPLISPLKVTGTPTAGTLGGSFGVAAVGTGVATGLSFYYSEVGNFGLNVNAIFDSTFTSVDAAGVDCRTGSEAESFSNTLAGGRYGCSFGSVAIAQSAGVSGFGRFIPDNFNVSYNTPEFGASCGSFTYVGQAFTYTTGPVITVTARNGINNGLLNTTTVNYAGAYAKLTNTSVTPNTQSARYSRFDALAPPPGNTPALDTAGLPAIAADPAIAAFVNGVSMLTFNSGSGLLFTRGATAKAPFNAEIALAVNIIDTDAVAYAGNPAQFGAATAGNGIAFGGGNKAMRFGRLKLSNAHGSELLNLPVPIGTEYWNGISFVPNSQDSCTSIAVGSVDFGGYQGGITVANMLSPGNVNIGGAFVAGKGSLMLTKPTPSPATKGSVDVTINLTTANKLYLGTGLIFNSNPVARATFGIYKRGPIIYSREMY